MVLLPLVVWLEVLVVHIQLKINVRQIQQEESVFGIQI
jgi:hypothetical protein